MPITYPNPTIENIGQLIKEKAVVFAKLHKIHFEQVRVYESETGWVTVTN